MCHGSAFGGGIAAFTAAFRNLLLLRYLHNVKDDLLTRWRRGILCLTEGISMPLGNCCLPSAQGLSLRLPPNKLFAINLRRYLSAIGNLASLSTCDQMGLGPSRGAAASTTQRKVSCDSPFGRNSHARPGGGHWNPNRVDELIRK